MWVRMYSNQGFMTWQSKLLMKYKYVCQAESYQICALMKAGHDQSQIAKLLDRNKATISRELKRNSVSRGYRHKKACEFSAERAQNSRNAQTVELWVRKEDCSLVHMHWSSEQIAARFPISHETLYRIFMRTRLRAEFIGKVSAARSKRESATRVGEIGGGKSPTDVR